MPKQGSDEACPSDALQTFGMGWDDLPQDSQRLIWQSALRGAIQSSNLDLRLTAAAMLMVSHSWSENVSPSFTTVIWGKWTTTQNPLAEAPLYRFSAMTELVMLLHDGFPSPETWNVLFEHGSLRTLQLVDSGGSGMSPKSLRADEVRGVSRLTQLTGISSSLTITDSQLSQLLGTRPTNTLVHLNLCGVGSETYAAPFDAAAVLRRFSRLTCLSLSRFPALTGQLTRLLEPLENLQFLHLGHIEFQGEDWRRAAPLLGSLRHLSLSRTSFAEAGTRSLALLSLRALDVNECRPSDHISVEKSARKDYARLTKLTKLELWCCSEPMVDGIVALAALSSLRRLILFDTSVGGRVLTNLANCSAAKQLSHLQLNGAEKLSRRALVAVGKAWPQLEELLMAQTEFEEGALAGLSNCTALKRLDLSEANPSTSCFYDDDILALPRLPALERLIVDEAPFVSKEAFFQVANGCPKLRELSVLENYAMRPWLDRWDELQDWLPHLKVSV